MSREAFTVSRVVHFRPTRRAGDGALEHHQRSITKDAADVYLSDGGDKYALGIEHAPIDCDARLSLCHAACCRLRVPLTRQDLDEGIVQWDGDQPYLNRRQPNGYCVHCDSSRRCTVYEQRPGLCRTYDCREDGRIWVDFDHRIPNPSLDAITR
jgi:hypothetical protein